MPTEILDNHIRFYVYHHFLSEGRAPTGLEVAGAFDTSQSHVLEVYHRLAGAHVLVLQPDTGEVWMAMPLSAMPTGYRVVFGESSWWAN